MLAKSYGQSHTVLAHSCKEKCMPPGAKSRDKRLRHSCDLDEFSQPRGQHPVSCERPTRNSTTHHVVLQGAAGWRGRSWSLPCYPIGRISMNWREPTACLAPEKSRLDGQGKCKGQNLRSLSTLELACGSSGSCRPSYVQVRALKR